MAGLCAPCRRFACALASANARLGADVDRYSFIASDLHRLLLAGLPAHNPLSSTRKSPRAASVSFANGNFSANSENFSKRGRECPRRLSMREGRAPQAREPPHLWLHLQKVKRSKVERRNIAEATGISDFADADRLWDPTRDPTDRRPLPGSRIRRTSPSGSGACRRAE